MEQYLKVYPAHIKVDTPIFIGSGQKLGKKEYIHLFRQKKVIVPEFTMLYKTIERRRLEREYIKFMDSYNRDPLAKWLRDRGLKDSDFNSLGGYQLDAGDAFISSKDRGKETTPKNIDCFMKDAYGMPFVPGSSIKGMLRTCLLTYEIQNMDRNQKESVRNKIRNNADTYGQRVNRNIYLKRETEEIEAQVFHTLDYVPEKRNNAVNSNMSGFIVSDSKPLTVKDLTLSQKIDVTMDGAEKPLPILRETLKPGTDISFSITIDSKSFPYSIQDIKDAIQVMGEVCQEHFFDHFGMDTYREGAVWIGGGSGLLSKTIIYALFDHEEAVRITDQVFKNTLAKNYSVHKHNKDIRLGLAPHTCKCTRYDGMLLPMGKGIISF